MSGALQIGGGGGTAFPLLSKWAGLCLHPVTSRMRGVLSTYKVDPSTRSFNEDQRVYESLQGSPEVCPLATPRRYHDIQVPLTLPSPRRGEGR